MTLSLEDGADTGSSRTARATDRQRTGRNEKNNRFCA